MELNKLMKTNYKSIVDRGLINKDTNAFDFLNKFDEELSELKECVIKIRDSKNISKSIFNDMNEELADVIMVGLNMAYHYDIDIIKEIKSKIEVNKKRSITK